MSNPRLPAEMLDHIVDYLHDKRWALKQCCLVSKSWIPRTRKHLFANLVFTTVGTLQSWKNTFPVPSTSPAGYVKTLFISGPQAATAGSWIRGFSRVENLEMCVLALNFDFNESATPLVPFHGFSPVLKSLRLIIVAFPPSQIFNLILSFPLLEDLTLIVHLGVSTDNGDGSKEGEMPTATQRPTPPVFTGSLKLHMKQELKPFTRRLLSLPGGIHFRKLTLKCFSGGDLLLTTALIEGCSHTLESVDITSDLRGVPRSTSIDLSKAIKLKGVVFWPGPRRVKWVTIALQTITSKHRDLQQITIHIPFHFSLVRTPDEIGGPTEMKFEQWLELDRLLVQFWESRSIRPKLIPTTKRGAVDQIGHLLPEITNRGIADIFEQ